MCAVRTLRRFARVLIGAMVFAQAAVALAVCNADRPAPAQVIASSAQAGEGESCHDQGENANLGLVHCLGDDQNLNTPQVTVYPLPPVAVLDVAAPSARPRERAARCERLASSYAAPPQRILFRSFQI